MGLDVKATTLYFLVVGKLGLIMTKKMTCCKWPFRKIDIATLCVMIGGLVLSQGNQQGDY